MSDRKGKNAERMRQIQSNQNTSQDEEIKLEARRQYAAFKVTLIEARAALEAGEASQEQMAIIESK